MFSTPKAPDDPIMPAEMAQSRLPDGGQVRANTGQRATDRARAATNTILTSGSGVTASASTEKKTLLGQ